LRAFACHDGSASARPSPLGEAMRIAAWSALILLVGCGRTPLDLPDIGDDVTSPAEDAQTNDGNVPDGASTDAVVVADTFVPDATAHSDAGLGACSPATCNAGCCQGGMCVQGQSSAACGIGAAACVACKPGGSCVKGACIYPTPNCGPSNCAGCCVDANDCSDGTAIDACGFGGQLCQGCGPLGGHSACVPQAGGGGSCQSACGPSNCHGCCNGSICELGQSASQCGSGGQACTTCASSEMCAVQGPGNGGQCQLPCSPATCGGCCAGDVCAVGNQDIACGAGGAPCADCTTMHYLCAKGTCQP